MISIDDTLSDMTRQFDYILIFWYRYNTHVIKYTKDWQRIDNELEYKDWCQRSHLVFGV
jgi:hypothetical protein